MCAEDLYGSAIPNPSLCARDSLSNIPVTPKECRGPPVQLIRNHATLFNWPFAQDGQPASKYATEVEFAIWQNVPRQLPDCIVILLRPALLQADYRRWRIGIRDLGADFAEAFVASL